MQNRGILYIPDPLGSPEAARGQKNTHEITLVFNENERYLYQAQAALWELRRRCDWICLCAVGAAAGIAVGIAAQLPVERLALRSFHLFTPEERKLPRELAHSRSFARRNLSLVVSEVLLSGAADAELHRFVRALGRSEVCVTEEWGREAFVSPWSQLVEKNLLIPWKCV